MPVESMYTIWISCAEETRRLATALGMNFTFPRVQLDGMQQGSCRATIFMQGYAAPIVSADISHSGVPPGLRGLSQGS